MIGALTTVIQDRKEVMPMCEQPDWLGLYGEGWRDITPESYAHPAKFSRALIRRIYQHALEEGWAVPGDTCLDPFGGVALGAIDAMRAGLTWVGLELEQNFCDMGQGCDCTGISKADWVRYHGRWKRVAYRDGRHWCPRCLNEAEKIADATGQLSMFAGVPSASYVRNSGQIPHTEPHHYEGNIEQWARLRLPGRAVLLQGDSRQLARIVGEAGLAVSSPPYAESLSTVHHNVDDKIQAAKITGKTAQRATWGKNEGSAGWSGDIYSDNPPNLGNLPPGDLGAALAVSSPPYTDQDNDWERVTFQDGHNRQIVGQPGNYGPNPSNLGNLPAGDPPALAISSPPYTETAVEKTSDGIDLSKQYETYRKQGGGMSLAAFCEQQKRHSQGYGSADGQLAAMRSGSLDAALSVSSPPFGAGETRDRAPVQPGNVADCMERAYTQDQQGTTPGNLAGMEMGAELAVSSPPYEASNQHYTETDECRSRMSEQGLGDRRGCGLNRSVNSMTGDYGDSPGQLAGDQGDTFWAAARAIIEQLYLVLKPGAHAIWVTKRFIRDGAIVDFSQQWASLCEACGFRVVHWHRAWLVEERGTQYDLDGQANTKTLKRSSFFRRLYESKYPENAIDWEDVICTARL